MELENERIIESVEYIKARVENIPDTVIIIDKEFSELVEDMDIKASINYSLIPHFPVDKGNEGELIYGLLNYSPVLIMSGISYYYNGHEISKIIYPIKVFRELNVKNIIIVNMARGINYNFIPGDFMMIKDHINLTTLSILKGNNIDERTANEAAEVYDNKIMSLARQIALELNITINEGVYAYTKGPEYETPTEVKALRNLGVDAVGFSVVPEALSSKYLGLNVLGISYIKDMASGISGKLSSIEEIEEVKDFSKIKLITWLKLIVRALYLISKGGGNILGEGKYLDGISE